MKPTAEWIRASITFWHICLGVLGIIWAIVSLLGLIVVMLLLPVALLLFPFTLGWSLRWWHALRASYSIVNYFGEVS